jgi:hypothetical protein
MPEDVVPIGLFRLTATLLKYGVIEIENIWPHLSSSPENEFPDEIVCLIDK